MKNDRNIIQFDNSFGGRNLKDALAVVYRIVEKQGYSEIILDFSGLISAYESAMVPFVAYISKLRREKDIDIHLYLPRDRRISSVFLKSQWAHYLSPDRFEKTEQESRVHTPLQVYSNYKEQSASVDNILNIIMNSVSVTKDNLNAIEWSLNEITDNVVNHAGENVVGYVQALKYSSNDVIEFVVADCGVGIPSSLGISDDVIALEKAIEAGVTRNKETNQGNGLYGSFNIARVAGGQFNLISYYGSLFLHDGNVRYRKELIPFPGTMVRWSVKLDQKDLIRRALRFGGKEHEPQNTYIERIHDIEDITIINMKNTFKSFGSRQAGQEARTYITNILESERKISLDFKDVNIISSSFADEVFGKMFKNFGATYFTRNINLTNLNSEISGLIDRSIGERMKD